MTAYYNENDPYPAQWLRNLIEAGHIAPGEVDERSIEDVTPNDLRGFTQCHFFAGVGGWSLALRLAGWPDDRPAWTGSCPCQPFSTSGKGKGFADERHLWPAWFHLVRECRPPVVFGEQVASSDGLTWFDLVSADLEGAGYAVGAADYPAAGVGAPHNRPRAYWVADAQQPRCYEFTPDGLYARRKRRGDIAGRRAFPPGRDASAWIEDGATSHDRPQPGICARTHGVPRRVDHIRAYGNAIVPQVAARFVQAVI